MSRLFFSLDSQFQLDRDLRKFFFVSFLRCVIMNLKGKLKFLTVSDDNYSRTIRELNNDE